MEIGQAKGMTWKVTFHLPPEATQHERKFPKEEVRYLSVSVCKVPRYSALSIITLGVMALAEAGEE